MGVGRGGEKLKKTEETLVQGGSDGAFSATVLSLRPEPENEEQATDNSEGDAD